MPTLDGGRVDPEAGRVHDHAELAALRPVQRNPIGERLVFCLFVEHANEFARFVVLGIRPLFELVEFYLAIDLRAHFIHITLSTSK